MTKIDSNEQAVINYSIPTDEIGICEAIIKEYLSPSKHEDEILSKELEGPILLIHAFKVSGKWYSHLERKLIDEEKHLLCEPWGYHPDYDLMTWIKAHPEFYSPVRCTVEDGKKVWNPSFTYTVQVFLPNNVHGFCIFAINPLTDKLRG